ncbi:MAG TPA: TIGR03086 family metal-binding protein [Pseudonocardiaceae bacterium]|nr:TIGR03086 family metal-binding protein [Pseudonocardiaceae bacterium]
MTAFDRAAVVVTAVVAGITDDQYGLPTPCTEWTSRSVLNHIVIGNMIADAIVAGRAHPDRSIDRPDRDPKATLARSPAGTRAVLGQDGLLQRTVSTPMGEAPGPTLVHTRVAELLVHSGDLATATGQATDLDPELAEYVMAEWSTRPGDRPRSMLPFADPQPVPNGACAADRLAAYLGRPVVVA